MPVITLLLFCLSFSHAKTAYVGVADLGGGRGVLGHVFLVLADEPGRVIDATAYQFALEIPDETGFDLAKVGDLRRHPFRLERRPAWAFVKSYTEEDRAVTLFRLDLDDAAVDRLEKLAEAELERRRDRDVHDFSLDTNCATRTFDLVNQVAPEGKTIDYYPPTRLTSPLRLTHVNAALLSIPVSAMPRLAHHALIRERVVFRPRHLAEMQAAIAALAELRPLFAACKTSHNARELLTRAYGQPRLRHSREYVDAFRDLLARCAHEHGMDDIYEAHLDFVLFDAEDPEFVRYVDTLKHSQ